MSMLSVQAIVIRAVLESDYREMLFRNPIRALEGYDLTEMEYMWLYKLERKVFESFAPELRSSISPGGAPFTDLRLV